MQTDHDKPEFRLTLLYAAVIGVLSVGYRLVPPYLLESGPSFLWNMMPIGALALFAGSRLPGRWSWAVPLGAMVVSDLLLIPAYAAKGADSMAWTSTPFIYASFLGYVFLGRLIPRESRSPLAIVGLGLAGSLQFFVITNLATWAFGVIATGEQLYPVKNLATLIGCFDAAIPFYRGTFLGDLIFPAVFFAGHALLIHAYRSAPVREAV